MEQWVVIKMKASQPSSSRAEMLASKICPKCRKKHSGVEEELAAENELHEHDHGNGSSNGASHGSPEQPQTPLEVQLVKSTATIVTSSVVV